MWDDYEECFEIAEADAVVLEYQNKMKELLVKPIIDELKYLKEENERLKKENSEVPSKGRELDSAIRDFNTNKKKIVEEENAKYRKTLIQFNYGDSIYIIDSHSEYTTCTVCSGKHSLDVDAGGKTIKVICPHCDYAGKKMISIIYSPKKLLIESGTIHFWNKFNKFTTIILAKNNERGESTEYKLYTEDGYRTDFYPTIEECQLECDRKNKITDL